MMVQSGKILKTSARGASPLIRRDRSGKIRDNRHIEDWRKLIKFGGCRMVLFLALLAVWDRPLMAQEAGRLRLEEVIELARQNYPAIRVARAEAGAAEAGSGVARTAYLPRTEIDWQQTRGTRNNIFGPFFPQAGISPISGPILDRSSFGESVWGSGGGLLVTWELFDFGLRRANVNLADRLGDEARVRIELTELETMIAAADRFLQVAAAEQAVRSATAAVERMEAFAKVVGVLVENELRPGADSSRADVELATAQNRLIQAQQQAALARVSLAEAIGLGGQVVEIAAAELLENRPARAVAPPAGQLNTKVTGVDTGKNFDAHPLLRLQRSSMETVNARKLILDRSLFPRIGWQTTIFARGSGARIDGRRLDNRGYYPDTPNWMTGLTLTFTPSDFFRVRASRRLEEKNLAAAEARFDQARQQLKADEARARAIGEAAEAFSLNAPRQLEAARLTELRARKRYEAELSSITEVAEAQNLLAQAEVEMGIARLSLWRARLAEARAAGDLAPFIALLRKGGSN